MPSSSDEELIPTSYPAIAVEHVPPPPPPQHHQYPGHNYCNNNRTCCKAYQLSDILNIEHYKCQNTPRTDWSPGSTWNKHYIIMTWLFRPGQLLSPEQVLGIFAALLHQQTKTGDCLLYWYSLLTGHQLYYLVQQIL